MMTYREALEVLEIIPNAELCQWLDTMLQPQAIRDTGVNMTITDALREAARRLRIIDAHVPEIDWRRS